MNAGKVSMVLGTIKKQIAGRRDTMIADIAWENNFC